MIIWLLIFSCSVCCFCLHRRKLEMIEIWTVYGIIVDCFPSFAFPRQWHLLSSSFTFLSSKPRFFIKKFFVFAVICSSVSSFTGVMLSTIMQAWRWLLLLLKIVNFVLEEAVMLAFLVTSSTPSNSSTLFKHINPGYEWFYCVFIMWTGVWCDWWCFLC